MTKTLAIETLGRARPQVKSADKHPEMQEGLEAIDLIELACLDHLQEGGVNRMLFSPFPTRTARFHLPERKPCTVRKCWMVAAKRFSKTPEHFASTSARIVQNEGWQQFLCNYYCLEAVSYTHLDVYKRQLLGN